MTIRKYRGKLIRIITPYEQTNFLSKIRGFFISRGKSSLSYKYFHQILVILKKKFKVNPILPLRKVFLNLVPIVGTGQRRMGRTVRIVPIFLKKNKSFVLIIDWLLRDLKNRTNIRGVKIDHLGQALIDTALNKGLAVNLKFDYVERALALRYELFRRKRKFYNEQENKKILNFKKFRIGKILGVENKKISISKRDSLNFYSEIESEKIGTNLKANIKLTRKYFIRKFFNFIEVLFSYNYIAKRSLEKKKFFLNNFLKKTWKYGIVEKLFLLILFLKKLKLPLPIKFDKREMLYLNYYCLLKLKRKYAFKKRKIYKKTQRRYNKI